MKQPAWNTPKTLEQPQMKAWVVPQTSFLENSSAHSLAFAVAGFAPISLKEMDSVALLNRVDTKFVMREEQLFALMPRLFNDYRILTIENRWINHYRTLYFDTPDFKLYQLHVNGNAERFKVRYREYVDSCQSFLEVKHKTRKGRTIKERIPSRQPYMDLTPDAEKWLEGIYPFNVENLEAKLWNTFARVTLISQQNCERITLDTGLIFYSPEKFIRLDGLAIAEVKADSSRQGSLFLSEMIERRIHPHGFSKYCMGTSLLFDDVKKNQMKPKLLMIQKMIKGVTR